VVALILNEISHARMLQQLDADPEIVVWWATPVECVSALARREREGTLPVTDARIAWTRLRELAGEWQEIVPSATVRNHAERLLRIHPLRAGDALQLAAAIVAAEGDPQSLDVVTFDERLKDCAVKEGFSVL
jgi:predicted nucleic acid-binding protein